MINARPNMSKTSYLPYSGCIPLPRVQRPLTSTPPLGYSNLSPDFISFIKSIAHFHSKIAPNPIHSKAATSSFLPRWQCGYFNQLKNSNTTTSYSYRTMKFATKNTRKISSLMTVKQLGNLLDHEAYDGYLARSVTCFESINSGIHPSGKRQQLHSTWATKN